METNFRLYLQDELARRCKNNSKYSLRAFAKFLETEPSFLSKILSQKRKLTPSTVLKFSRRLNLEPAKTEIYLRAIRPDLPMVSEEDPIHFRQIALDSFHFIADWYHYAILELVNVDHFQPSERWIARSLDISLAEAKNAVERLVRLGFIKIEANGKWVNQSGNNSTISHKFTDVALKKLQRSVLEKALMALEEVPIENRDQTSMTFATDPALIPQAKEKIKTFRRSLTAFLENTPHKKAVYNLGISLYPISKFENQNQN